MNALAFSHGDLLAPGTTLGRYELLQRLAIGGMAELYLARATGIQGFQKLVALKRILPQYAVNDEFVAMFLDEARLAATLQHANIAQVYDIGQSDDALFFTMEFIHGEDVRSILKTSCRRAARVPIEHALAIIAGAAAGLHAAHEKTALDGRPLRIVHRDVSPSNVIVSYDGGVKIIDFGVAKAARRQRETRTGTLKGKIAYMSPEQCRGEEVDRQSDVFALGIVLYELSTGQRLFQGDNEFAIMQQIVTADAPPPSTRVAGYPSGLEAIVMKALARDKRRRYATAQALQLDLESYARAAGLVLSAVSLGDYMRELFAGKLEIWQQMQRASTSDDHLEVAAAAARLARSDSGLSGRSAPAAGAAHDDGECEIEIDLGPAVDTNMFAAPTAASETPASDTRGQGAIPRAGLVAVAAAAGAAVAAIGLALLLLLRGGAAPAEPAPPPTAPHIVPAALPAAVEDDPPAPEHGGVALEHAAAAPQPSTSEDEAEVVEAEVVEPAPAATRARRSARDGERRSKERRRERRVRDWDPDSPLPPR
jgi:serine/threonine protein kinase